MSKYYYDLHIHSCLSPCADNDMTPNNIANMAALAGLNVVALTDHNSTLNCPAFFEAAKKAGIIAVAGMELTTAEEIHVVCLFETLDDAMRFNSIVDSRRIHIPNNVEIFGEQLICDGSDNIIGTENALLTVATDIGVDEAKQLVDSCGGVCFPAHVDRESNSMVSVLGSIPSESEFTAAEFYEKSKIADFRKRFDALNSMLIVSNSDAHYLWDIRDKDAFFEFDDETCNSCDIRARLFEKLRGKV